MLPLKLAVYYETAAALNRQGFEGMSYAQMGATAFNIEKSGWCSAAKGILKNWGA
jgi:hypothetical protein